jgi:hypothetical protein
MAASLLANDRIKSVLQKTVEQPGFPDKLAWWLIGAHSVERWFQFEIAYQLHQLLPNHHVICEVGRQDIAVVVPGEPSKAVASMELKLLGNWYTTGQTFTGIARDATRVKDYGCESVALAVWVLAQPKEDCKEYDWFRKQVADRIGVSADVELVKELMKTKVCAEFELLDTVPVTQTAKVDQMELAAFVYRNQSKSSSK